MDAIVIFILGYTFPFYSPLPLTAQKMKISKQRKKTSGDHQKVRRYYHFTQLYQKSWSHAIFTVPEIWHLSDVIAIFHFGLFFALLPPKEIKISKNWKQILEISSFYKSVPKIMILCYTVPEIWHVTNVFFFHFGLFLALLPC